MGLNEEVRKLEEKLQQHEIRISRLESLFKTRPEVVKKKISVAEFILSKKPKDDVQKTLAIGYYLERHDALPSFNKKDLKNGFRMAKEPFPENINYKVIRNVVQGYMMEAEEKKENLTAWVLTNSGAKCVENNFKKEK